MATRGPASVLDRRGEDNTTHVLRDRLTRQRSPARPSSKRYSYGSDCSEEEVVSSRITQPYRTSFSAVAAPIRTKKDRSRSTSPCTSSLKGSDRSRSKSPGGRRSRKHVTYDDRVVIRESEVDNSVRRPLSDSVAMKSSSGNVMVTEERLSATGSKMSASQPDYSSELRELSQQIVREYSAGAQDVNGKNSPLLASQSRNIKMSATNGKMSGAPVQGSRPTGATRDTRSKIVIQENYDHDQSISYRAAIKANYSEEVKRKADSLIETMPLNEGDLKKPQQEPMKPQQYTKKPQQDTKKPKEESAERRNSLPIDEQVEANRLTQSKRSISASIGNFFRRLSPHLGRKNKKGTLSNASSQSLSRGGDDLDGSFDRHASTSSLSRGKFRRSLRKLFGKPKKGGKSDASFEDLNRSQNSSIDSPEGTMSKSSRYMKSIDQSSKTDKDMYHKFKEKQQTPVRSGDINAPLKPRVLASSPKVRSPVTSGVQESAASEQGGRADRFSEGDVKVLPPNSLDVKAVPKSVKSLQVSQASATSGDDYSIGECSIDPNLTGSEPSLISETSASKQVTSSQLSQEAIVPSQASVAHSQLHSAEDASNSQNKSDLSSDDKDKRPSHDLSLTCPQMPIISDSADFLPKEIVRTPSYLRISSAVSGYGHYSKYSAYKGIEKRTPYSSTLSLRSSLSDLTTPLSPVEMPIGKIPNLQPPTNYPPIKSNVLTPKGGENGTDNVDSGSVATVTNGARDKIIEDVSNGLDDLKEVSGVNGEINGENGHSAHVGNYISTGDLQQDADYFLSVAQAEENRLLLLCSQCEQEMQCESIPDEACGKIRSAVGKANLLVSQKFRQFQDLCIRHKHPDPAAEKQTKCEDLQGFWEMVKLQVDDLDEMFTEIELMKQNGWREIKVQSRRSSASSSPKSGSLSVSNTSTPSHTPGSKRRAAKLKDTPESSPERMQKAKMAAKVREDARKKLLAEKRAAMKQQKMNNDNGENVEIYVADSSSKSNSPSRTSINEDV